MAAEATTIALLDRIGDVAEAEWDALYPDEPERWAYLRAVEDAVIPGFQLFYVAVRRGERLVAAAPGFVTGYRVDTTVQRPARAVTDALYRAAPFLLRLKLISLGSPVTETALLGVLPGEPNPSTLIAALYEGLEQRARSSGVRLLAVKDIPSASTAAVKAARGAKLNSMSSLPTAVLDLTGLKDLDGYLASLSHATRKDLRRKLKNAEVSVERVADLAPHADAIDRLYASTRARAAMQFEELSWRYFQAVLERMGENAAVFLYRLDGEVIGFNLLVGSGGVWIDKYFCTDERGPPNNLYFLSWLENVRFVLARDGHLLVAGQTAYDTKLRFGCRLEPTTIFFRHGFAPVNAVLALASRFLGAEQTDPALKNLSAPTTAGRFPDEAISANMAALRSNGAAGQKRPGVAVIRPAPFLGLLDPRKHRTRTAKRPTDPGASTQVTP